MGALFHKNKWHDEDTSTVTLQERRRAAAVILIGAVSCFPVNTLVGHAGIWSENPWVLVLSGIGLLLLMIVPMIVLCKVRRTAFLCVPLIIVNVFATALCVGAYTKHIECAVDAPMRLEAAVAPALLGLITACIVLYMPDRWEDIPLKLSLGLNVVAGIVMLILWVKVSPFYGYVWFALVMNFFSCAAAVFVLWDREHTPVYAALSTFSFLAVIALAVVVILMCAAGGECCDSCDGCDCDCGDCGGKKKKSK